MNQCPPKSHEQLAQEWDNLAPERLRQLQNGEDLSFEHVLVPTTLELLDSADRDLVLDVGAGTGVFTSHLARRSGRVLAFEPSTRSVAVARKACRDLSNVTFVEKPLEESDGIQSETLATAGVAFMTLMTAPSLESVARSLAQRLRLGATFVAMTCHPCFWPRYWGYDTEPWFNYNKELFIEGPFVISNRKSELNTTHIHRPLGRYLKAFADEGFQLKELVEPFPTEAIEKLYPKPWLFPRFLALRWRLGSGT